MGMSKFFIVGLAVLSLGTSYAAEVDQFSRRNEVISDAAPLLNSKANAAILKSIELANKTNKGCSEEVLYEEMREYFSNHFKGELIKDILADENIENVSSIFQIQFIRTGRFGMELEWASLCLPARALRCLGL